MKNVQIIIDIFCDMLERGFDMDNDFLTLLGFAAVILPVIWPFIVFSGEPFGIPATSIMWGIFLVLFFGFGKNMRKAYRLRSVRQISLNVLAVCERSRWNRH